MPALEMKEVRKIYGSGDNEVVALDHATLTVGDDEMVALVGPSGSGKTTLLSIVGGLLSPSEGAVERIPRAGATKDHSRVRPAPVPTPSSMETRTRTDCRSAT